MQTYFNKGAIMRVCGGSKEVHGFEPDELVKVVDVRPEPELSHVAMCADLNSSHAAILMIEEVEDL